MLFKTSVVLVLSSRLFGSSYASPTTNATALDGRATCTPAAENCDTTTCCPGLFCSTTEPHLCSACAGLSGFCLGVPCCAGLFCGGATPTCGPCVATG
ncbi:hypothetical protein B0H19DRAFT_1104427 [Mycena capillaripes]|nr:hypothetical protein B0H19DRAFT_1104427 [Mycena capillaripes]